MIKGKSVEMEVTFEVNELAKMKRPELQQLCKSFGIKANMKVRNFHSMIFHSYAFPFKMHLTSRPDLIFFATTVKTFAYQYWLILIFRLRIHY